MEKKILQNIFFLFVTNLCFAQKQVIKKISNDFWVDSLKVYKNYSKQNIVENYNKSNNLEKLKSNVIYSSNYEEASIREVATNYSQTYTYDDKNRPIEQYTKNGYGVFQPKNMLKKRFSRYEYNEIDSLSQKSFGLFDDSLGVEIIYYKEKYEYNVNKKLTSKKTFQMLWPFTQNSKLYLYSNEIFEYNKDNQIVLREFLPIAPNSSKYVTTYYYDEAKRLIKSVYDDLLAYANKLEIEYDENGNVKKECYFNKNNANEFVLTSCNIFLFDLRKNLLKREYLAYENGEITYGLGLEYQYNDKNKVIFEKNSFIKKDKVEYPADDYEVIYKYNVSGNLMQSVRYTGFMKTNVSTNNYTYNNENNLVEQVQEQIGETTDFNGKKYIFKDLLTTKIEYSNAVNEDIIPEILVFPNPANAQVTVLSSTENDCLSLVTLNDLTGKEILKFEANRKNYYQCSWSINLPSYILPGEYIVAMKTGNGKSAGKRLKIIR